MSNKNTVKYKVLKRVSTDVKNPTSRKDLQKFIWDAQGNNPKDFEYRQGYYCVGIQEWNLSKLIKRIGRGLYVLDDYGKMFVENPRNIRLINKAIQYDRNKERHNRHLEKMNELFYENMALRKSLNQVKEFIDKELKNSFNHLN